MSYIIIGIVIAIMLYNTWYLKERTIKINEQIPYSQSIRGLHISDIHGKTRFLNGRLSERVNKYDVDYIFITGDLANSLRQYKKVVKELSKINSDISIYIVLGNHERREWWGLKKRVITDLEQRIDMLQQHPNIQVLINQPVVLKDNILLYGIDNSLYGLEYYDVSSVDIPRDSYTIIMAHAPKIVDFIDQEEITCDLILAGHTHGNQINIPILRLMIDGDHRDVYHGLKDMGSYMLHVSKGIGTSKIPLRLNSMPEITLLDIYT